MRDIPSFEFIELYETLPDAVNHAGGPLYLPVRMRIGPEAKHPRASWMMLTHHSKRQCTRLHDRVYGLLGMLKEDDPMRQIDINYDKPAPDVLFDALFTMSTLRGRFANGFMLAVEALLNIGLMEDPKYLKKYRDRDLTLPKCRTSAAVTLEVFDAMNLIIPAAEKPPLPNDDSSLSEIQGLSRQLDSYNLTELQWETIIGTILAAIGGNNSEFGADHHLRRPDGKSPWLCAKHARPMPEPHSSSPQWIHATIPSLYLSRVINLIEICAEVKYSSYGAFTRPKYSAARGLRSLITHSQKEQGCDGSKMILDIPSIGYCLEMDSLMNRMVLWLDSGTAEKHDNYRGGGHPRRRFLR